MKPNRELGNLEEDQVIPQLQMYLALFQGLIDQDLLKLIPQVFMRGNLSEQIL
jgi:hypothetical protein